MAKILEHDVELCKAFLKREAEDFRYIEETKPNPVEGRKKRIEKVVEDSFNQLQEELEKIEGGGDFIIIASLTNLGVVDRELRLTCHPFEYQKGNIVCNLPPMPVPKGRINVKRIKKE